MIGTHQHLVCAEDIILDENIYIP